jgi:cysteine desulfurase
MRNVYLDHTATTPLDPAVFDAMKPYFTEKFGNASSIHSYGQVARAALDESRDRIAGIIGARSSELTFVGSGTEADNFALKGVARSVRASSAKNHIITSAIEHHAVLETCRYLEQQGFEVTYLQPDAFGMIDPGDVRKAIASNTGLISVMHANNEIGTVNSIKEIGQIAREHGIVFHSDAVQTFGKMPIAVDELTVDLLSISAHKIYGPKGIGGLYIRKGVMLESVIHGGGQERGRRAGTENVPLAVGFAEAAARVNQVHREEWTRMGALREILRHRVEAHFPSVLFNGHPTRSLPHILNISFDSSRTRIDGEALLFNLDLNGIATTSGSACSSGSIEPSHVLLAIGRDRKTARASIRFSMGRSTTEEDIEYTVDVMRRVVGKLAKPAG